MSELNIFGLREYSRKDIFEDTTDEIRKADRFYIMHEADKVIAELKEERRWRKFPDEKPELGDIVLVNFAERNKGHYYPMDVVRWDSTYELGEIEVSHWMPLQSAPKEEK